MILVWCVQWVVPAQEGRVWAGGRLTAVEADVVIERVCRCFENLFQHLFIRWLLLTSNQTTCVSRRALTQTERADKTSCSKKSVTYFRCKMSRLSFWLRGWSVCAFQGWNKALNHLSVIFTSRDFTLTEKFLSCAALQVHVSTLLSVMILH